MRVADSARKFLAPTALRDAFISIAASQFGIAALLMAVAARIALREPRNFATSLQGTPLGKLPIPARQYGIRLLYVLTATAIGLLSERIDPWWIVATLSLLLAWVVGDLTPGSWTGSLLIAIGLTAVVTGTATANQLAEQSAALVAHGATWAGWSVRVIPYGIAVMGAITAMAAEPVRPAFVITGWIYTLVGAISLTCQWLTSHDIPVPDAFWGKNDGIFTGTLAAISILGVILIILGKLSIHPKVVRGTLVPIAVMLLGAAAVWRLNLRSEGWIIVALCGALGAGLTVVLPDRRRRILATSGALWLAALMAVPSLVGQPSTPMLLGGVVLGLLVAYAGIRVARMSREDFQALP